MAMSRFEQEVAFQRQQQQEQTNRLLSLAPLKLPDKATEILYGWGMEDPFIGQPISKDGMERWVAWQGQPDYHQEVPLLVARIGLKQAVDTDSTWSYGFALAEELATSPDPAKTILDAAYWVNTPAACGNRLVDVILSLSALVPPQPK